MYTIFKYELNYYYLYYKTINSEMDKNFVLYCILSQDHIVRDGSR